MERGHTPAHFAVAPKPERLESIDLLRGVVMIVMALDHVRDFLSERLFMDPTDLKTTTVGIFLTRWITHYCAPTFIFLAGTSAFLSGTRGKSKAAMSWLLLTRGLWFAFFEVVINRMLWMFNFDLHHHGAGVFWAIGWSMVLLSVLIHLPTSVVTIFGVAMISLHNLLDGLTAQEVGLPGWLWTILHSPGDAVFLEGSFSVSAVGSALGLAGSPAGQGPFLGLASLANGRVGDFTFGTGYCLLPWMGTMAAGYGFGKLLLLERSRRRTYLFLLGTALTLAFVSLRTINGYGDPKPRLDYADPGLTICSFLNCTKYPASLLYLLMTLGPSILALAAFDRPLPPLVRPVITFGRVPLFYYLLHVPLIHGGAVLLDYFRFGWSPLATSGPWLPREEYPPGYGISLPVVYIIWVGVVLLLYPACRWFAGVKQRRREAWLSYF